ncbi:superoxide dismutase family protein [Methylonatrum kenyense]|uniref:superoxide dismutase family protein n=1 Tax=Methylonatrum kenyense TaxID=455253 RepID=UPI0020BE352E|nr:superoxide dismutase family protein [Methylonatrum kenyense]MCK8517356.1 superoxide dismutase family protein [Methylonatrum kenyense]
MSSIKHGLVFGLFVGFFAGWSLAGAESLPYDYDKPTAVADFINTEGEGIGRAELIQGPHGMLIMLHLENVAPGSGFHGIHMHQRGDCSDPEHGFPHAGGHVHDGEAGQMHGLMHPDGPHAGDLPSIYVHEGVLKYELFTTFASLDGSIGEKLLGEDGASFIIHENPDDHYTQPVGGAGRPIACAEIRQQ